MKKKFAIILLAILAVSAFSFLADVYAMPFMNMKTAPPFAIGKLASSYVRMDGVINQWGTQNVQGLIHAQSRTIVTNAKTLQGYSSTAM
jgi:hypothetical protein